MKFTNEQHEKIGDAVVRAYGNPCNGRVEIGIAAVAAVAPLLLAEPDDDEVCKSGDKPVPAWKATDYERCRRVFAKRLASLTAKPDPAVEAVADILFTLNEADSYEFGIEAAKIVAAVDAARAK